MLLSLVIVSLLVFCFVLKIKIPFIWRQGTGSHAWVGWLSSDCRNIDGNVKQRYKEAMYDIYASKRANAANKWINKCTECKVKVRIPKTQRDSQPGPTMLPKKSKLIYKCPKPQCKRVYCSTCGQCIYNRYQYDLHRC